MGSRGPSEGMHELPSCGAKRTLPGRIRPYRSESKGLDADAAMAASPPRGAGVRFARVEGPSFQLFDQNVTGVTDVPSVRLYNLIPAYVLSWGWGVQRRSRRSTA